MGMVVFDATHHFFHNNHGKCAHATQWEVVDWLVCNEVPLESPMSEQNE